MVVKAMNIVVQVTAYGFFKSGCTKGIGSRLTVDNASNNSKMVGLKKWKTKKKNSKQYDVDSSPNKLTI